MTLRVPELVVEFNGTHLLIGVAALFYLLAGFIIYVLLKKIIGKPPCWIFIPITILLWPILPPSFPVLDDK